MPKAGWVLSSACVFGNDGLVTSLRMTPAAAPGGFQPVKKR